jgi:hypothetical protein
VLEAKLDDIDKNEERPLFLGSSRSDKNGERLAVLSELEEKLLDYGKMNAIQKRSSGV